MSVLVKVKTLHVSLNGERETQIVLGNCACEDAEQKLQIAVPKSRSQHFSLGIY